MLAVHHNRKQLLNTACAEENVKIAPCGSLIVATGQCTGRSPKAKVIVRDTLTMANIDEKNNQFCSSEVFKVFEEKFMRHVSSTMCYQQNLYAGADERYQIQLSIHTSSAWQGVFANNMFITERSSGEAPLEHWSLYCFPEYSKDPRVMINFSERKVFITGTWYAGEIKKSIFTALNFILPSFDVLPMHCSVNVSTEGDNAAIFFGLSGTGKTTLSADRHRVLVGDDEHGWSADSLFNFEGGCYAKVIDLSESSEPEIWNAVQQPGAILENVIQDHEGNPDFSDKTLTENTRASYPLDHIPNVLSGGVCDHPNNVIFLTCDAFGVLPPVSKLEGQEVIDQFLMGYTAKVAGTEAGVTEPQATFSHCFGAPFMPRKPEVYAELLAQKVKEHSVNCWLVNTGWSGGQYGTGDRMPIEISRAVVREILCGDMHKRQFHLHTPTGLTIPCASGESSIDDYLIPEEKWKDKNEYAATAKKLMDMWSEKLKK